MKLLTRAVLVTKESKLEYDLRRLGWPLKRLLASYRDRAGVIVESHERQAAVRERLASLLPELRVVRRENAATAGLDAASLVVALGGDNHFIYVSHFLSRAPLLGVNADRVRSHGGLLRLDERHLARLADALRADRMTLEDRPRLRAVVDGRSLPPALSELFIGERERKHMSRHTLAFGRREEEHKSSGLLVATPAGSTGWYGHYGRPFKGPGARWALTEPFPRGRRLLLGAGTLAPGQRLRLRSLSDSHAVVASDSLEEIPLEFARTVEIGLMRRPLKVARVEGL